MGYDYYINSGALVVRAKRGDEDPSHIEMRTSSDDWVRVTLARGSTMTPVSEDEADEFWRTRIAPKPPGEGEDKDLDASWENGVFRAFERHLIRRSSSAS